MKPIGMRAQDSLRLEKGYGVWSLEFAQSYTAAMCGLDRFIAFDKGEFIGREAALAEREARRPASAWCCWRSMTPVPTSPVSSPSGPATARSAS